MKKMRICGVSDEYINYLRSDPLLSNVTDNKEDHRVHMRKYVGVVLEQNGFLYFAPFSSPKKSDYTFDKDGKKSIRKSIVPIIRMTEYNKKSGKDELKGTIKLSNMIPVPRSELVYYDISGESDPAYQALLWKEYSFVRANRNKIMQFAKVLYNQKSREDELFPGGKGKPGYLGSTVLFPYAEQKCMDFMMEKGLIAEKAASEFEKRLADAKERSGR